MLDGDRARQVGCLALATSVLAVGTLATGLLPSTELYQALAGGVIVLAFALAYGCIGTFTRRERDRERE